MTIRTTVYGTRLSAGRYICTPSQARLPFWYVQLSEQNVRNLRRGSRGDGIKSAPPFSLPPSNARAPSVKQGDPLHCGEVLPKTCKCSHLDCVESSNDPKENPRQPPHAYRSVRYAYNAGHRCLARNHERSR